ncbi:hypothetical protein ACGFOU_16420 [Streptomyces sp. NPDC048595]|uniref:hypothetical protein n=1 Tax=Streptomyces sp. NPDC048595 TaxID=3365576 RepID=UPI00371E8A71
MDAEHIRLDAAFAVLDERARALPDTPADALPDAQHALYLALSEVISAYLSHLHLEETVAMRPAGLTPRRDLAIVSVAPPTVAGMGYDVHTASALSAGGGSPAARCALTATRLDGASGTTPQPSEAP